MISTKTKVLSFLAIISLVIFHDTFAAQQFGAATVRAGKCFYSKKRLYIPPGEKVFLDGCKEMLCIKDGPKLYLEINSCGAVEKECRIPGDKSLPYPMCCSRNKCLDDDY